MSGGGRAGTETLDDNEHVLPSDANADQGLLNLNLREDVAEEKKLSVAAETIKDSVDFIDL